MARFKLGRGEYVRADMCAPLSSMTFPFLELVLITGICWIVIGFMDQPGSVIDVQIRNLVVALWALLAAWRFVLPLLKSRKQRFVVTNKRVLARSGELRNRVDSIPLSQIHSARRYKGGISLAVYGFDRPIYFANVGKSKKVEQILRTRPREIY
ncbi:PH domain-containing protein [Corynebacterium lubricantis]|uniref:PH domain-containing protein n=1 Tax=Corynebacterium lubricantis TaxID=541095 RepID=UPI00039DEAC9|nr:PH domain-containing protein [Corynebacterium lubricantis]